MKAVITVIGRDTVGLLAKISTVCAQSNANVIDVTQTVMQDFFAMVMLVDMTDMNREFISFSDDLKHAGEDLGLKVHVMHEDIFNSMHRI